MERKAGRLQQLHGKLLFCSLSPGLEAPPALGPGDHARDVDGNRCASALGGVQSRKG